MQLTLAHEPAVLEFVKHRTEISLLIRHLDLRSDTAAALTMEFRDTLSALGVVARVTAGVMEEGKGIVKDWLNALELEGAID